ncbi:bifunctional GNAT family N-acetyltransferase/carbon-nitrogen hydrolase family protein [Hymenobacter sp. BT770]|uniref:bifunctional GNAT family N-acetyltransferase/carbon-nitrogen hydrolase family protein n=1 Tax=Hymenobacter sp. BT770 TaxID=2886942 RepID=UPI001D10E5D3|nr:bifunctional GNAT family N-acetyltransferase/carbon-nitrogen hydrolase family protein [Hymenobacter sp. BT770]MCC3152699.1 bifunctional GNAT family N-acetyltransferase/carbon-nitrogen hydrolase family protein [Hymenobacter sp. BT770]MDO3414772.1 bifunctional GNAT family N-acetyltransferase/carbon-nitrogen hydrolase family protein [Hymenobacter sp. BT770]
MATSSNGKASAAASSNGKATTGGSHAKKVGKPALTPAVVERLTPTAVPAHKLVLRTLRRSDFKAVKEIMDKVYSNMEGAWAADEFAALLRKFPEGQIGIEDNGRLVAAALAIIVQYSDFGDRHTYAKITGHGKFDTHNDNGDTLYGVDVFVDPEYRSLRLGRRLYDARKELCENLNLRAMVAGGRIPGYAQYANEMTPAKYVEMVRNKEVVDPILTFQLSNEFHVRKIIRGYLPYDSESKAFATLLEWINVYYEEEEKLIGNTKSNVRIGIVQWQMRATRSLEDLLQQMEFFVDTVSGYKADCVMFPEFFNAPLMALTNEDSPAVAIRAMAAFTEPIKAKMMELAVSYNINIVAGSMPVYEDGKLFNVAYLCRRDGTVDEQYKLHVTPDEASYWGMRGGDKLKCFDTDFGKIGILVCYDVEFPELARMLSDEGVKILFVPFWTDTKNAYQRVRICAQARAIENECYVAITGSVGNLPRVENMDIQYSQSAVFSPSDFAFPHDAIVAEATPNTEMTLIADLDLDLLKDLNTSGAVRNLRDRRKDLYSLGWTVKKSDRDDELLSQGTEERITRSRRKAIAAG